MTPAEALTLSTYTNEGWVPEGGSLFPSGWEKEVVAHGRDSVALSSDGVKFPVVLFSHGFTDSVPVYTSLIEELASHGFVVAAISHTYDADITEFPDGSVAYPNTPWEFANGTVYKNFDAHTAVWVADAHFVLDQLTVWNTGDPQRLLSGRLDLDHVGYFGHSLGGAVAAEVCALDPRLKAGINLDGPFFSPVRLDGGRPIPTPFLIQLNADHATGGGQGIGGNDFSIDSTVPNTYGLLEDAGYEVRISNSMHNTFCDVPLLADKFEGPEAGQSFGGTIDPRRAISIINAYDLSFFEKHLKGTAEPLLVGPTPYPEVTFTKR
jgi:pimeloyl-ACP methyl ester carboxylesterase